MRNVGKKCQFRSVGLFQLLGGLLQLFIGGSLRAIQVNKVYQERDKYHGKGRNKGDNNVLPDSSLVHLDHVYGRVFLKMGQRDRVFLAPFFGPKKPVFLARFFCVIQLS